MNAMDKKSELSLQLLLCCRNELYSLFPYLDGAFACLKLQISQETASLGTDGKHILFSPDYLISLYSAAPEQLRRGYLHMLLHCLYLHLFRRKDRELRKWNLACDMAVEQIIEKLREPRLQLRENPVRRRCLNILGDRPLAAEEIYCLLEEGAFQDPAEAMEAAFLFDDHRLWTGADAGAQEIWHRVLSYTGSHRRRGGSRAGTRAGSRQEKLEQVQKGVFDYRKYLKKFAVSREEMELDLDSFDYIYYYLGLETYGNLPLIEPLEYREGHKLQQLVIAIDTSGSCDRETVQNFLSETYSILSQKENFFRKMEVYLIQCDCLIQSVAVIHSREEWQNYSREITVAGRGGTDFSPVFQYVDDLRSQGKLRALKALLYFTDGDGYFPREKPPYETAFVFLKRNEFMEAVPAWAVRLLIDDRGTV